MTIVSQRDSESKEGGLWRVRIDDAYAWLEALDRARAQGIHVQGVRCLAPTQLAVARVPARRVPGLVYGVVAAPGRWSCTCDDGRAGTPCAHAAAVINQLLLWPAWFRDLQRELPWRWLEGPA